MHQQEILDFLISEGAIYTESHFVFTSGSHGSGYVDLRRVAHYAGWLRAIGAQLANLMQPHDIEVIVGPETLGRTLAGYAALTLHVDSSVWCDIVDGAYGKIAQFSPKLDFGRLLNGKRVGIVDDLLTTGSSIEITSRLVNRWGGIPVCAAVAVRRSPDVTAIDCGVEHLHVLADIPGFNVYTEADCAQHGPCSKNIPMTTRPGHGWKWATTHPDYPIRNE